MSLLHKIGHLPSVILEDQTFQVDNFAILLCSYYETHPDRPENDESDGDETWGPWVIQQCDAMLARIVDLAVKEGAKVCPTP